jgi:hypothetical protein
MVRHAYRRFCAGLFISAGILSAAAQEPPAVVENPLVPNAIPGLPKGVRLNPDGEFNRSLVTAGLSFASIQAVALDSQSRLFVLDSREARITVLDRAGHPLNSFGRRGQGPGEFNLPQALILDDQGRLVVLDGGSRTLSILTTEGSALERITIPLAIQVLGLFGFREGMFYLGTARFEKKGGSACLEKWDSRLTQFSLQAQFRMPAWESGETPPRLVAALLRNGGLIYGSAHQYSLTILDGRGHPIAAFQKKWKPVPIPKDRILALSKDPRGKLNPEAAAALKRGALMEAFNSIREDPQGRFWIGTNEKDAGGNRVYDLFAPDGRLFARASIPGSLLALDRDAVYVRTEDEQGFPSIARLRIEWIH